MAAVWVFLLTLSTVKEVVSGVLSHPTNVRLTSWNLNVTLSWDPPAGAPSGLIYTTELGSTATPYSERCQNITSLHCFLSAFPISSYGKYRGRVRALLGGDTSAWVESNNLTLDIDTLIGPPSVTLLPIGPSLEVAIKDPVFFFSSLRNMYSIVTYNITYWKKGQEEQPRNLSNIIQDRVILPKLDPMSEYCVQVQINTIRNKNPSEPSRATCERTGNHENHSLAPAVAACVVIVLVVALTVLAVVKWNSVSQFFWPKVPLPRYFKESLLAARESSICLPSQPTEELDPVSVVTGDEGTTETAEISKQLNGLGDLGETSGDRTDFIRRF